MNKEFVMRGQTASGTQEVLNFSGLTPGYAYRLTEFEIFPSTSIGNTEYELVASVTAAKTYEDPENPNYDNAGLIATSLLTLKSDSARPTIVISVVNDTFLITQDLILAAVDTRSGTPMAVNWQCRFLAEKLSTSEEAVTNYKQFTISNDD